MAPAAAGAAAGACAVDAAVLPPLLLVLLVLQVLLLVPQGLPGCSLRSPLGDIWSAAGRHHRRGQALCLAPAPIP
jgi:hypothetical protein